MLWFSAQEVHGKSVRQLILTSYEVISKVIEVPLTEKGKGGISSKTTLVNEYFNFETFLSD